MWMRVFRSHELTAAKLREALDGYRELDLPRLEEAPGFLGIAIGEDAERGSILSLSFWADEASMKLAERVSTEARHRALPLLDGSEPILVDHYEVTFASHLGVADRWSPYMYVVRFNALTYATLKIANDSCRADAERHLPSLDAIEGVILASNRKADSLAVVSFWPSEEAMRGAQGLTAEVASHAASAAQARRYPQVDSLEVLVSSATRRLDGSTVTPAPGRSPA